MTFKIKEIAEQVVEEATIRFSPLWKLNQTNFAVLKQYCDFFENFARENNAESLDFEVSEETMKVILGAEMPGFEETDKKYRFSELLQRATSFNVSKTDEGLVRLSMEFPSLWERR